MLADACDGKQVVDPSLALLNSAVAKVKAARVSGGLSTLQAWRGLIPQELIVPDFAAALQLGCNGCCLMRLLFKTCERLLLCVPVLSCIHATAK